MKAQINQFLIMIMVGLLSIFISEKIYAQSQVEIDSEINIGESDAAAADEEITRAHAKADKIRDAELKKKAKSDSKIYKARADEARSRSEQMRTQMLKIADDRKIAEVEAKMNLKKLEKLEKEENISKIKLEAAKAELQHSVDRRDEANAHIEKVKDSIQKLKLEVQAAQKDKMQTKVEGDQANQKLKATNKNLNATKKWKVSEIQRIHAEVKKLKNEQLAIEQKIRASSVQIGVLTKNVNDSAVSLKSAKEDVGRANALKAENDAELTRLNKINSSTASGH
jgi:hypothetical protein